MSDDPEVLVDETTVVFDPPRHPRDVLNDLVKAYDDAKAVLVQFEAAEAAKISHSSLLHGLEAEYAKAHDWFLGELGKLKSLF